MNFDNADIQSVVKFLSMISNIPVVIDPDLSGNISIACSKRMTLPEAYEVISAALHVRGYSLVGGLQSKVIRVIPLKRAITDVTGVDMGKTVSDRTDGQTLISQVVPLDYANSDTLRDQLKPLISSDQASVVSIPSTNTLIITDDVGNVKRLMEIIKRIDVNSTGLISVEVYPCRYGNSDNLAASLSTLFQTKTASSTSTQTTPSVGRIGRSGGPGGGAQAAAAASTDTGTNYGDVRGQITIVSDTRTNRLIISGTKERIQMVIDVAKQLDVDTESEVKVRCFSLKYADAAATAEQLNSMFEQPQGSSSSSASSGRGFGFFGSQSVESSSYAGLKRNVVVADVRTNSVIVTATEQNMKSFESIIKEVDSPKVLSEVTKVYPLRYALASNLATVLSTLFKGTSNTSTSSGRYGFASILGLGSSSSSTSATSPLVQLQQITVVAEPKTNSLLVTGPPSASALMDDIIPKLDKRTAQVFIEVAIVDVTLDHENEFGVEWDWHDTNSTTSGSSSSTNFGEAALTTGLKYSILNNNLQVLLHALQSRDDVKVLSTPTVTTADNVQAKISIGEDVPYTSSATITSGGNTTSSVAYQTVAIALTVTPHVNGSSDVIGLDVNQTINEIVGTNTELNAPIVADREAATSVTVRDGQTIVIGGIIQEQKSKVSKGVPILSSIPLLGSLFKSQDDTTQRTELMVFLTPRILTSDTDVDTVTTGTRKLLTSEMPKSTVVTDLQNKPVK
jgi:general secretion pathway protein D